MHNLDTKFDFPRMFATESQNYHKCLVKNIHKSRIHLIFTPAMLR